MNINANCVYIRVFGFKVILS